LENAPMKIRDVLGDKGRHVVTVWPDKQLDHIPRIFDERNIASVVVVDHAGKPLGIVTDREVLRALARHGTAALGRPVSEVMQSPAPSCGPDDTVNDVLRIMTETRVRHVLVLEDRAMAGLVSIGDLVKFRLKDAELENRVLRELALTRLAAE
jgi:CBS domain-containing protein